MTDIISMGKILGSFRRAFRRFPLTVVLLIGSVIWGVLATRDVFGEATVPVGYFLGTSWIFSLTIGLWCEAFGARKRTTRLLLTGALTLVAADAVWLYCNALGAEYSDGYVIARMSIIAALTVGAVFVPVRGGEEGQWWFSARQMANLLTAAGIAGIISIALIIILSTVQALFDCDTWQWFDTVCIVFAGGLPALIFLSNIPAADEKQARQLSGFFNGLIKYILLPLTLVYMAILYIYGCKILLAWELPRGGVAWPVMWSVFCVTLFLYAIRPFSALETSMLWRKTIRRLPMAMLPLLLLLAVAIGYRVGQYGVTTERLYVVTFTLWSFAAMLYWGLSRKGRIVPAIWSLAAVFVAVSVVPGANFYAWGSRAESRSGRAVSSATEAVAESPMEYSFSLTEPVAIPYGAAEVAIERLQTTTLLLDADGRVHFRLPSQPYDATLDVQPLLSDSTAVPEVQLAPPTASARVRQMTLRRSPSDSTKVFLSAELLIFQ